MSPGVKAWFGPSPAGVRGRKHWAEAGTVLVLLTLLVGAWWSGGLDSTLAWVGVAAVLLTAGAVRVRRSRYPILGPVFAYDLVRTARRRHHAPVRCVYAGLLLLILFLLYCSWFQRKTPDSWDFLSGVTVPPREMAEFAQSMFFCFMTVQFVAVLLLTPAYTAGAIAEEKDRRTLDFLLATDLSNREIVLGIWVSRLSNLLLILLTGLPVFSLLQFLGGIEPRLLLAGFAAAALTAVSLASLSILMSVRARKPLDAVMGTYFWAAVCLLVSGIVPFTRPGNTLLFLLELDPTVGPFGTAGPKDYLGTLLRDYAIFHVLAAVLCCSWAIYRLRHAAGDAPADLPKVDRDTAEGGILPDGVRRLEDPPSPSRPLVGEWPMLWKELYTDFGLNSRRWHPLVKGCLIALGGSFFIMVALLAATKLWQESVEGTEYLGPLIGVAGFSLGGVILLVILFRAAECITRERERRTLESLLTTPLEVRTILLGKWLGSILSLRRLWTCLAVIWLMGVLPGAIEPARAVAVLAAFLVYAAFLASLGLLCSVLCSTSLRATICTALVALGACVVPPFLAAGSDWLLSPFLTDPQIVPVSDFLTYGLFPPGTMYALIENYHDKTWAISPRVRWHVPMALAGLGCYAVAAGFLWRIAREHFEDHHNRGPWNGRLPVARPAQEDGPKSPAGDDRAARA